MKAGRELDALVAEHVVGCDLTLARRGNPDGWYLHPDGYTRKDPPCPHYSTDIAPAWEVVEKMLRSWWIGVDIRQSFMGTSVAFLPHPCSHPEPKDAVATVDPRDVAEDCEPEDPRVVALAICLAALQAVGVEVPDEA